MISNLLELSGVTKTFGAVAACRDVSLSVRPGEIHALLGENGAGKTTLMNILYGIYRSDRGRILWNGHEVSIDSTRSAIGLGIGMVHQHFMLVPTFTTLENVILGLKQPWGPFLDLEGASRRLALLSKTFGLDVDPARLVWQLPVGAQQRVEILKALYRNVSLLVLDEPTAVLTPGEAADFFQVLARLKSNGVAIILITHKLDEVIAVSDRVTVLRQGAVVYSGETAGSTPQQLAEQMVGAPLNLRANARAVQAGPPVLELEHVCALDDRGLPALDDISLTVHTGEVLGIAGVDGNGQRELAEVVTGLRSPTTGTMRWKDRAVTGATAAQLRAAGIAHIPQDRQTTGLVLDFAVCENAVLGALDDPSLVRRGFIRWDAVEEHARGLMKEHSIRPEEPWLTARALSGGNQQKLIAGREFRGFPPLMVAVQPTRGLDVGATAALRRRLLDHRDAGGATLLISTELEEICELSDRIAVFHRGRLMGIVPAAGVDWTRLGLMMTGTAIQ